MREILPNSWSRKGTVLDLGLQKTRWPNPQTLSKVLKELRELLELEKWCIRNFLRKWKINSGQKRCVHNTCQRETLQGTAEQNYRPVEVDIAKGDDSREQIRGTDEKKKKKKKKVSFDLIKENRPGFTSGSSCIASQVKHFWQREPWR